MTNAERTIYEQEIAIPGTTIYTRGWPDFLLERAGKIWALEIKAGADRLSEDQRQVHTLLIQAGLPVSEVYVNRPGKYNRRRLWDLAHPDDGLTGRSLLRGYISKRTKLEKELGEVQASINNLTSYIHAA